MLKQFCINFFRCGVTGWCMEILFTALQSFRRRELKLMGNTSVWMFPIYGLAAFISPLSRLLKHLSSWKRGTIYMALIYVVEFCSGSFLQKRGLCPWDYGLSKYNIRRVIRLDYAPYWFGAGLLFEKLTRRP